MNDEIKALLRDPAIGDGVKAVLVPEILRAEAAQRDEAPGGWRNFLQSAPVIAAMASIITLGLSETVKIYLKKEEASGIRSLEQLKQDHVQWMDDARRAFDAQMQTLDKEHERSLERLKFQFQVISSALAEHRSPEDRADALLFLTEVKLLEGLDDAALRKWGESEALPSIAAAVAPATGPARPTAADYKRDMGEDAYGPDTSALFPSAADLLRVLGCHGTPEGRRPPLLKVGVPYTLTLAFGGTRTRDHVLAHEAVASNFERAFRSIADAGLGDYASVLGGDYVARKIRGSTRWSVHSWGVAIDMDPEGNQFRWGEDQFTIHPGVVRAFKDAGFAWEGDRGRNAMSFVISTETLRKVEASGYVPQPPADNCDDAAAAAGE